VRGSQGRLAVRPVAGRVVNDPSRSAKISGEHFFGGAVSGGGEYGQLPQSFVERMKQYAISTQRSPDRPAELVALQILFRGSEEAPSVENSVSEELESLAVEVVAPALRTMFTTAEPVPSLGIRKLAWTLN
jgi:hypothetical protein